MSNPLQIFDTILVPGESITRPVTPRNPATVALHYGPSGQEAVSGALVSDTVSAAFAPIAGRTVYLIIAGSGSATFAPVYSNDGENFYPEAVGLDGGAPKIINRMAYDGAIRDGLRIPLQVDEYGVLVAVLPETVTGAVNFAFAQ